MGSFGGCGHAQARENLKYDKMLKTFTVVPWMGNKVRKYPMFNWARRKVIKCYYRNLQYLQHFCCLLAYILILTFV